MLFKNRFHEGIASGSITVTYRNWKRAQVRVGGVYKVAGQGEIEVIEVRQVASRDISEGQIRPTGFDNREEMMEAIGGRPERLYRIQFRFVGAARTDPLPNQILATDDEMAAMDGSLTIRDRNAGAGPWTMETLKAVRAHPGLRSADLAKILGRDQVELKRDMRKLKKLGLTLSLETGYRLSARGLSYLGKTGYR